MKLTVFGSGYVGLVTGACLADVGHEVLCIDSNVEKISKLKLGQVPIYEPGLAAMVKRNVDDGRLQFASDAKTGVAFGELLFIAVGTPPNEDGSADLKHVLTVAESIGIHMVEPRIVINKSTVPVGTADQVRRCIAARLVERNSTVRFHVCSNPEFLKEGSAIDDFTRSARIIVGTDSDHVRQKIRDCYAPYNRNHEKMIFMDIRSAELTKYAANAMLATKISFMNEMANLAERLGADIEQVRLGIGSDPRIGYHFIYPGCGYGGSCFPKDLQALARTAKEVGYEVEIINAVKAVNQRQKSVMFSKLQRAFSGNLRGKTIAVWGLAFKPNTDDMREAPSRNLVDSLLSAGAAVRVFDPEAMEEARRVFGDTPGIAYASSHENAVIGANALAICTEWKQFRTVDFEWLRSALVDPVIVDGRNLYEPRDLDHAGIKYFAIGRGASIGDGEAPGGSGGLAKSGPGQP